MAVPPPIFLPLPPPHCSPPFPSSESFSPSRATAPLFHRNPIPPPPVCSPLPPLAALATAPVLPATVSSNLYSVINRQICPDPTPPISVSIHAIPIPPSSSSFHTSTSEPLLPPPPLHTSTTPTLPLQSHSPVEPNPQASSHPPPCKSYAQATRGPRGHANDVEAFARIPRPGTHTICGSRDGMPSFSFVNADLPKVEEIYSNALVMKFLGGHPSL